MSVETVNFAAQVNEFVRATKERMEAVFRESTRRVVTVMQTPVADGGNMPVDTGFLRASIRMTKDGPLPLNNSPRDGVKYTYSPVVVSLVINSAQLGETLYASYTANYAAHQHYGARGKQGRQWITLAAQRWPDIVQQVSSELQTRATSQEL